MDEKKFDADIEELKYCYNFVQQVRTLYFWQVEPDEIRDKMAMVVMAKQTLEWVNTRPKRLWPDAEKMLTELCNRIIEAGVKSDTPMVLEPMKIGISGG